MIQDITAQYSKVHNYTRQYTTVQQITLRYKILQHSIVKYIKIHDTTDIILQSMTGHFTPSQYCRVHYIISRPY